MVKNADYVTGKIGNARYINEPSQTEPRLSLPKLSLAHLA